MEAVERTPSTLNTCNSTLPFHTLPPPSFQVFPSSLRFLGRQLKISCKVVYGIKASSSFSCRSVLKGMTFLVAIHSMDSWENEPTLHYKGVKSIFITILILTCGLILKKWILKELNYNIDGGVKMWWKERFDWESRCNEFGELLVVKELWKKNRKEKDKKVNDNFSPKLDSDVDSKDGIDMSIKHLIFRKETMCKNFKWRLGMKFTCLTNFKEAIMEHPVCGQVKLSLFNLCQIYLKKLL
ncbi:hypothetical protein CR513_04099, partial [Mucuna pruriens]